MTHPLDHDNDGHPGGSLPAAKRGLDELKSEAEALGIAIDRRWGERRLRAEIEKASDGLQQTEAEHEAETETDGQAETKMTVVAADTIHDGEGGFLDVGAKFKPADDMARAMLIAKGFAK